MRRLGIAAALAVSLFAATTAGAATVPVTHSALLVQTADGATLTAARASGLRTLVLSDADPQILALADRPSRASADLPLREYRRLWRNSFRADPPNAVLVGTTPTGGRVRVPVVLRSYVTTAHGVRYTASALQRTAPLTLTDASLLIDNANVVFPDPATAAWQPIINAVAFPAQSTVTAADNLRVVAGQSASIQCLPPRFSNFGTLTLAAGAQLVLNGASSVTLQVGSAQPQGAPLTTLITATTPAGAPPTVATTPASGMTVWSLTSNAPSPSITLTATQPTVLQPVTLLCY